MTVIGPNGGFAKYDPPALMKVNCTEPDIRGGLFETSSQA